jgi:hypothetical protein
MALIKRFGHMWARNLENIRLVSKEKKEGVYILYDGSMPVYVGARGSSRNFCAAFSSNW